MVRVPLVLLFLSAIASVNARQWQSIVDYDIARKANTDSSRYELKIEFDPFFFPGDKIPKDITTEAPKADANKAWTTISPTASPTYTGTWSSSSTYTESGVEQSDACKNGLKHYQIHMMDTWGDGWDQNTAITITGISDQNPSAVDLPTNSMTTTHTNSQGDEMVSISKTIEFDSTHNSVAHTTLGNDMDPLGQIFHGGLLKGYHESTDLCLLPGRCYQLVATGGEFLEEVSWELRPGNSDTESSLMEPLLMGGAPTGCTFSLPDAYGHHPCPNTCSEEILANSMTDHTEESEEILADSMNDHTEKSEETLSNSMPEPTEVKENSQPDEEKAIVESVATAVGRTNIFPVTRAQGAYTTLSDLHLPGADDNTSN